MSNMVKSLFAGFGGVVGVGFGILMILGLVAVLSIGGCVGCVMLMGKSMEITEEARQEMIAKSRVNNESFDMINSGMTLKEVQTLFDDEGHLINSDGETAYYVWYQDGNISGKVSITFEGGRVVEKEANLLK